MAEFSVDSLDDPRLAPYRELKRTNQTRWSGRFIAEGQKVVERLLASDFEVESVFCSEDLRRRLPERLGEQVDVLTAPQALAELIVGYRFHAGVLACGRRRESANLADLIGIGSRSLIIACPATTDPDNLGAILRTAAAFGASGALLGPACANPFSRRALRVAMGTTFDLPLRESPDFHRDLGRLQTLHRCTVIAAALSPDSMRLEDVGHSPRTALLLGNEAHGLDEASLAAADIQIKLPMAERVDSLNVSVAGGILMHHFSPLRD